MFRQFDSDQHWLKLLTALPANVAAVLKAKVDGAVAPSISSFTPTSGPVGTNVVINGANFTGATTVTFNGVNASFTVNSSIKITATVPTGATTGPIVVMAPGGQATSSSSFTVTTGGGGGGGTVTISQVYGGGGNSGATYKMTSLSCITPVPLRWNLSTYAVQYTSSSGSSWSETLLTGTLAAGHHYLIQEAAGSAEPPVSPHRSHRLHQHGGHRRQGGAHQNPDVAHGG